MFDDNRLKIQELYLCGMQPLRQTFLRYNAQTSDAPLLLEFSRAEGVFLYDSQGKQYLDLISGIGVSNVGHGHPRVVAAVREQAGRFMHLMVYGEFVQAPQVRYAEKLAGLLPEKLSCVYFTNSGAESVEGALKLAKRSTGRNEIIACRNSYHGSTQGALSVMGNEEYKQAYRPLLPGIQFIRFNRHKDLSLIRPETACVILETIQGEAGIRVPEKEYLKALRARCHETGTLLILDEIQTGMGRTGSLFAFEQYGIEPDILLTAKALGGGMPLGAFIASPAIMQHLSYDPPLGHITTFGGHPVCCAAGLAALEVLLEEDLAAKANEKGGLFRKLLQHPAIREFRGAGLLMALEFESFEQNKAVIDRCIEKGVITDWFLHDSRSMRLAPPLTIREEQIRDACSVILESIEEVIN